MNTNLKWQVGTSGGIVRRPKVLKLPDVTVSAAEKRAGSAGTTRNDRYFGTGSRTLAPTGSKASSDEADMPDEGDDDEAEKSARRSKPDIDLGED